MTTIREQIISALVTRLAHITTAHGYATGIGANALRCVQVPAESQLDYVAAWPRAEESVRKYGKNTCTMPVKIEAAALFGATDPSIVMEQLLGDVIECLTAVTWTLAFTAGATEITVGQTIIGGTSLAAAYVAGITITSGSFAGGDAAGSLTLRRLTGTFVAEDLKVSGSKVAETAGTIVAATAVTSATGGLADDIAYTAGGPENYPAPGDLVCGVSVMITVIYKTVAGNPFAQ